MFAEWYNKNRLINKREYGAMTMVIMRMIRNYAEKNNIPITIREHPEYPIIQVATFHEYSDKIAKYIKVLGTAIPYSIVSLPDTEKMSQELEQLNEYLEKRLNNHG